MKKITILIICFSALLLFSLSQLIGNSDAQQKDVDTIKTQQEKNKALINGEVFYPDGSKAAGATVYAYKDMANPSSGRIPSSVSGADGKFTIPVEDGNYSICAWKQTENYLLPNLLTFGLSVGGRCEEVAVSSSQPAYIGVRLAPRSNSLEVGIKGFDRKFSNTNIYAVLYRSLKLVGDNYELTAPEQVTWEPKAESRVNSDGKFIFNGLPSGTYFLRLESSDEQKVFYDFGKSPSKMTPIVVETTKANKIILSVNQFAKR